jgi:hypothetical protein
MRYVSVSLAFIFATISAIVPTFVYAETSCSEWRATCRGTVINRKKDPKICDDTWNACMKSGRWLGPDTGRDYGPAAKR